MLSHMPANQNLTKFLRSALPKKEGLGQPTNQSLPAPHKVPNLVHHFFLCQMPSMTSFSLLPLFHENLSPRDFPGNRVVETPHSQCRGPGFHPWPGN